MCWLRALDRYIPGVSIPIVASKVILDQSIWTPTMHSAYLGGMALGEGGSLQTAKERISEHLLPLCKVNWVFWGTVQCFTYSMVPLHFRTTVVSLIMIGWNGYMSKFNEKARQEQKNGKKDANINTPNSFKQLTWAQSLESFTNLTSRSKLNLSIGTQSDYIDVVFSNTRIQSS